MGGHDDMRGCRGRRGDDDISGTEDKMDTMGIQISTMMEMMKMVRDDIEKDVHDVKEAVKEARDAARGAENKAELVLNEVDVLRCDVEMVDNTLEKVGTVAEWAKGEVQAFQVVVNVLRSNSWSALCTRGGGSLMH